MARRSLEIYRRILDGAAEPTAAGYAPGWAVNAG